MMVVQFTRLTTSWHDPIDQWPYEAVVTTMERGLVSDWQPILRELRARPFGRIARYVTHYAKNPDDKAAAAFFAEALRRARVSQEEREREEVIRRIRRAIDATEVSQADFAKLIGTSASRLSTYLSGQVTPSAGMLVRIENVAREASQASG
jgi:ribosome-binding protein aMBF1 (putative translation factor)